MVNTTNIDDSLLSIVQNINENSTSKLLKEKKSVTKKDTNMKSENNYCIAAVPYATKSLAYQDIQKGIDVYMVKENVKGNMKIKAYSRCSKKRQEDHDYCHIHKKSFENNTTPDLKIFEKDIVPLDDKDVTKYKATIADEYFESMGKRGAKKKNVDHNFIFDSDTNPILMVLKHPNAKLTTSLAMFATQLIKTNTPISNIILKPLESTNINDNIKSINDLVSTKDTKEIVTKDEDLKDENLKDEDIKDEDIEDEDADDDTSTASSSIECISIKTMKGKEIFLEPDSNNVYDTDGDEGDYALLGSFQEIDEKYATIKYNDSFYTVFKQHEDHNYCVFTYRVFDEDQKNIGTLKKSKKGEIKFVPV